MTNGKPDHGRHVFVYASHTLTLLWAAFIAYGTLTPMPALPGPPRSDLIVHFAIFAILVLPTATALPRRTFVMVLIAIAFGGAIELIQPHVGRSSDLLDFLADTAGAFAGWGGGLILRKIVRVARIN